MTTSAHVYELVTERRIHRAQLRPLVVAFIEVRRSEGQAHWLVAVTDEQVAGLKAVPWIDLARRRGEVELDGDRLTFDNLVSGATVTIEPPP